MLLARQARGKGEAYENAVCAFAMKFQQYTSPVMAKAMEDTTFYQYNRLVSLNEVGGEPHRFGVSVPAFHKGNQARARAGRIRCCPPRPTTTSARKTCARASACCPKYPISGTASLRRWRKLNRRNRRKLDEIAAPSRNDEYLLYQTLLGIWPFEQPDAAALAQLRERVAAYMLKAGREAKVHSSWINPNSEYETATHDFVRALLSSQPTNLFLHDFVPFQQKIARLGAYNSLSQVLLKLTSPGVPDIYQGNEVWDFSLVDPDNRRPVDYDARRAALRAVRSLYDSEGAAACARRLLENLPDGRIKLYVTWKTLSFRRENEKLFRDGNYLPLKTGGQRAEQVCAFARHGGNDTLLVVVPRLIDGLLREEGENGGIPVGEAVWGDSWLELPPDLDYLDPAHAQWINILTDEIVSIRALEGEKPGIELAGLFRTFPYALLRPHKAGG